MVAPTERSRARVIESQHRDIQALVKSPEHLAVLKHGIRSAQDLQRAFELLRALEPEDGGLLVEKAIELQVRFNYQDSTHFPHEGVGATTAISSERISDRSLNEVGEITFNTGNPEKPNLTAPGLGALKHELVHAIPLEHLPNKYREAFTAEGCAEPNNINSIYKSVLSNLMGDEALAMMSGVSLLESAREKGVDLRDYPAQRRDVEMSERWIAAAGGATLTFSGMTEQLRSHDLFYSSAYRSIALRIACHRRFGDPREKIDVAELLDNLTTPVDLGGTPIRAFDPEKVRTMLIGDVLPSLPLDVDSIIMGGLAIMPALLGSLNKLTSNDNNQVQEFFSKDMDRLVEQIARLIEDERVPLRESPFSPSDTPIVPTRSTPVRAPVRTREVDRSEVTANKVRILGKYVDLMHKLAGTTATEVATSLGSYLNLAEHCDPRSSAQVYSLLIKECLERELLSVDGKRDVAFSLLRSGYEEQGSELLASVIEDMTVEGDKNFRNYSSLCAE
jgi:hypothetical protein